ncbi:hypothetical protein LJC49_01015 [Ruminococcaceae bacterium OttesenSCG-928-I18]|nr:hypothetical protein [Ruminococcaceae bacterium OttesenSCG-928-I18]
MENKMTVTLTMDEGTTALLQRVAEGLERMHDQNGTNSAAVNNTQAYQTTVNNSLVSETAVPSTAAPQPTVQPVQAAPVPPVAPQPVAQPTIPTTERTYALDDLARAGASLMDTGKSGEAMALLGQFGIQTLTQLPPERYGEYATALRGLGAKI